MNPLTHIRTINGRELDHPRYGGRYGTPVNNNNHSTNSDDLRSTNHIQQPQQEPRVNDSFHQGCYGASFRSRNYVFVDTPVQGGFSYSVAEETSGGSAAAGDQSACGGIREVVFGRTGVNTNYCSL